MENYPCNGKLPMKWKNTHEKLPMEWKTPHGKLPMKWKTTHEMENSP